MTKPQFCPLCDITLDLHDGPDSCESAESKVEMMEAFYGIFDKRA